MPDDKYIIPKPPEPERTQSAQHPKEQRRANIAIAIAFLAAIFTAWQAWEARLARREMSELAKRAIIRTTLTVGPESPPFPPKRFTLHGYAFSLTLLNTGQAPAIDIKVYIRLRLSTMTVDARRTTVDMQLEQLPNQVLPSLPSGDSKSIQLDLGDLMPTIVDPDELKRDESLLLEGRVEYRDKNVKSVQPFCYTYLPNSPHVVGMCSGSQAQ